MKKSVARALTGLVVAAAGICGSIRLGVYAERDDAPGGVVISVVLLFASAALGAWIALHRSRRSSGSA